MPHHRTIIKVRKYKCLIKTEHGFSRHQFAKPCHNAKLIVITLNGLREERFVSAMGTVGLSFTLSLSFVSWGVEVGSCLGKDNEKDLFPLKYTLFSATAFASSVSILSFTLWVFETKSKSRRSLLMKRRSYNDYRVSFRLSLKRSSRTIKTKESAKKSVLHVQASGFWFRAC